MTGWLLLILLLACGVIWGTLRDSLRRQDTSIRRASVAFLATMVAGIAACTLLRMWLA